MKITLWTQESVARARPLLARLEADLEETRKVRQGLEARAALVECVLRAASPTEVGRLWREVVRAQDEVRRAADAQVRLRAEIRDLNGSVAGKGRATVRLAGVDGRGRLGWWTASGADFEPLALGESARAHRT